MPVPDEWHDLTLFFGELRLHAEYGVTSWLSADLLWSLRVVHVGFVLEDAATRMPLAPPFGADIHHRTETLVGLTNPWLSARAVKRLGPWAFVFRAGLTLPVGATVDNPFELGREGKVHEHIQFGTGTVNPLAGVELHRAVGPFAVAAWMLAKSSLYENAHHYRAGSQLLAGGNVSSALWTSRFWFMLGALVYDEQPERWNGVTETEGNLGRTESHARHRGVVPLCPSLERDAVGARAALLACRRCAAEYAGHRRAHVRALVRFVNAPVTAAADFLC